MIVYYVLMIEKIQKNQHANVDLLKIKTLKIVSAMKVIIKKNMIILLVKDSYVMNYAKLAFKILRQTVLLVNKYRIELLKKQDVYVI